MKKMFLYVAALMLCFSLPALADNSGIYLGIGSASTSMASNSCANGYFSSCNTASDAPTSNSSQIRLIGGYDFNRHFGIEAGYSDMGTYRVHDSASLLVGQFKATVFSFALKAGNTFANGMSIFGKLGLASVNTKYTTQPSWILDGGSNQRSRGLTGGIIGQYNVTEHIGFRVSLDVLDYTDAEFHNIMSGISMLAVFKL